MAQEGPKLKLKLRGVKQKVKGPKISHEDPRGPKIAQLMLGLGLGLGIEIISSFQTFVKKFERIKGLRGPKRAQ